MRPVTLAGLVDHPEAETSQAGLLPGLAGLSYRHRRLLLRFDHRSYHLTGAGYRCGGSIIRRGGAKLLFDAGLVTISRTLDDTFVVTLTYEGALAVQAIKKLKPMVGKLQPRAPNYGQLDFGF